MKRNTRFNLSMAFGALVVIVAAYAARNDLRAVVRQGGHTPAAVWLVIVALTVGLVTFAIASAMAAARRRAPASRTARR
jgi:predicted Co/Zn/Cd cation transporter (cation efflux family)